MHTSPGGGPQPTRGDRPRDAALRVLRVLVDAGPATLAELTETLGGHPNTTRHQVELLLADGFVADVPGPVGGRGRPARRYVATVAGRQVSYEDPDRPEQGALVEAIAEHLVSDPDPIAAAREVGASWGRRLASGGRDVVATLAAQGFTPEAGDDVRLLTCPMLDAARHYPDVICAIHQGQLDAMEPGRWRLLPFAEPDACLIRAENAGSRGRSVRRLDETDRGAVVT